MNQDPLKKILSVAKTTIKSAPTAIPGLLRNLLKGSSGKYVVENRNRPTATPSPQPDNIYLQIARNTPKEGQLGQNRPSPTLTPAQLRALARNPAASKYNISPQVNSAMTKAAETFGVPASLLADIALQESSFDPTNTAKRGGFEDSTAAGLFMFNDPTWQTVMNYANMPNSSLKGVLPNTDRMDPNTAAIAAAYLIKFGQLGRWDESKGVWGKHYSDEELSPFYTQTKR